MLSKFDEDGNRTVTCDYCKKSEFKTSKKDTVSVYKELKDAGWDIDRRFDKSYSHLCMNCLD